MGHHPIYFFYLLGMKFKNMRELKKFKSKNKYDDDENDDQSESSFSGRDSFLFTASLSAVLRA